MIVIGILTALTTAIIWAWVSIVYSDYMRSIKPLVVNFLRVFYASVILLVPAVILGLNMGAVWGSLSGLLSLVIGDSLYLMSIKYSGVSVAAPVSYTYIPIAVLLAVLMGESLTIYKVISGLLIVLGVYLLSSSGESKLTIKGILLALGASVAWALGYSLIKVADVSGLNPISLAFIRTLTASVALMAINYGEHNDILKDIRSTVRTRLPLVAVLDLGVGVALYAYSIDLVGLSLTVIVTGATPLIAQVMVELMGKERLTITKLMGAIIIVTAVILAML